MLRDDDLLSLFVDSMIITDRALVCAMGSWGAFESKNKKQTTDNWTLLSYPDDDVVVGSRGWKEAADDD